MSVRHQPRISEDRIAFRVGGALAAQLRLLAATEGNNVSSTARRLLSAALRREHAGGNHDRA